MIGFISMEVVRMKHRRLALAVSHALAASALLIATPAFCAEGVADAAPRELEKVVVQGQIVYRDRADVTPPTLVYDLEYFQRFEPRTVGDMLKRVPSVAFLSDVIRSEEHTS